MRDLKDDLQRTHLDDDSRDAMVVEDGPGLASPPNPELTRTKKRLMERLQVRPLLPTTPRTNSC